MDNKIFRMNGEIYEDFLIGLKLLFGSRRTAKYWIVDEKKGFVFFWEIPFSYTKPVNKFPVNMTAELIAPIIWEWMKSEEGANFENTENWEGFIDMGGSQKRGWLIYVEDWGRIKLDNVLDDYAIGAVRPVWLWFGK